MGRHSSANLTNTAAKREPRPEGKDLKANGGRGNHRGVRSVGLLVICSLLVAALLVYLHLKRMPTYVEIDLVVSRMQLTVGGDGSIPVFSQSEFRAVEIQDFDKVTLRSPIYMAVKGSPIGNPPGPTVGPDGVAGGSEANPVEIRPAHEMLRPSVLISGVKKSEAPGLIDQIWVDEDTVVTLEPIPEGLSIALNNWDSDMFLDLPQPFVIDTRDCRIGGDRNSDRPCDYMVRLDPSDSLVPVLGHSGGLSYTLQLTMEQSKESRAIASGCTYRTSCRTVAFARLENRTSLNMQRLERNLENGGLSSVRLLLLIA